MKSNTTALYRKISQDQVLSAKLSSISDQDELAIEVIRLGEQFALPVILEDVREYLEPRQNSELNDDELEMVVGGKGGKSASASVSDPAPDPNRAVYGSDGNDNLTGGSGNSRMMGCDGNDTMDGGSGDDAMQGGFGNDSMIGGIGNDFLNGDEGHDTMEGGSGNDNLDGGSGNDSMSGGSGNDWLSGDYGNDTMDGGDGDDFMHGGSGSDFMSGGSGNDTLTGDFGNDTMNGGAGNDTLTAGWGNDIMTGGAGSDVFVFDNLDENNVITDFNPAEDKIQFTDWREAYSGGNVDVPGSSIGVVHQDGNTVLTYGDTTITLQGVTMSHGQVMACVLKG